MKVILRQNHDKLGQIGEIVDVKEGFANNFLIPRGIAYAAKPGNLRALEDEKKQLANKRVQEQKNAENLASEIEKISVTIPVQVGEEDKIFGSVTNQMIADFLKEKGHDIDRRKIDVGEPIKALGIYDVNVKLHPDVNAKVKVWVVRE